MLRRAQSACSPMSPILTGVSVAPGLARGEHQVPGTDGLAEGPGGGGCAVGADSDVIGHDACSRLVVDGWGRGLAGKNAAPVVAAHPMQPVLPAPPAPEAARRRRTPRWRRCSGCGNGIPDGGSRRLGSSPRTRRRAVWSRAALSASARGTAEIRAWV